MCTDMRAAAYFEVSSLSGEGTNTLLEFIVRNFKNNKRTAWPASDPRWKDAL